MSKTPQPHRIEAVKSLFDYVVHIAFADGLTTNVNLADFIFAHPVLHPLRDKALFKTAALGEWGFDISWDNGGDLSIAATAIRTLAEQQTGGSVQKFNDWMQKNNLSLAAAADSLGMTRRMIIYYRTGTRQIPKTVMLACKGWEAEQHERSHL